MLDVLKTVSSVILTGILAIYLVGYLLDLVLKVRVTVRPESAAPAQRAIADNLVQAITARSKLSILLQYLVIPPWAAAWPTLAPLSLTAAKRLSNRQFGAKLALKPVDGLISVTSALLLVIVTALHNVALVWEWFLMITTWIALVAVVCKEVSYLISPLPDRLRQSNRPPWPSFLAIALADAAAFGLGVAALRSFLAGGDVTKSQLKSAFLDVINIPDNIVSLLTLDLPGLPLAILGLLYSSAMLKTLAEFSRFSRTDDDYRRLAEMSALAGNTDDTEKWISKVKERDITYRRVQMEIALASGDFTAAAAEAGRILAVEDEPNTEDTRLILLSLFAVLLPLSADQAGELLVYVMENASDAAASVCLADLAAEYPGILPSAEGLLSKGSSPLTYAAMLQRQGRTEAAAEVLERASPGSELDEMMRLLSLACVHLLDPTTSKEQDREYARSWRSSSWPTVRELGAALNLVDRTVVMVGLVKLEFAVELLVDGDAEEVVGSGSSPEFAALLDEISELATELTPSRKKLDQARTLLREQVRLFMRAA